MKERETFPGKTYAVLSPNGCLVTKLDGNPILTLKPGVQDYFVAPAGKVLLTDDAADVTENFDGIHTVALKAEAGANKAMRSAMDSATEAATSATQAEESAAKLGDAALKSADNTFTGNNIFTGSINGVPAWMQEDMLSTMYRDMVLTEDEIKMIIPADVETWANYPVPNGDYKTVFIDDSHWKKVKRVFCKFSTSPWYPASLRKKSWGSFDEAVYFLTEKEQHIASFVLYAKKATLLAPKLNFSKDGYGPVMLRLVAYCEEATVYAPVCQNRLEMIMGDYVDSVPNLKSITVLGVNVHSVVKIVVKSPNQVLKTRAGFPEATKITISDMELNKASVLPILNNLLTYDSATMTAVPTLTICMHTDLQADEEVQAALALASTAVEDGGKGWQVTTQWNGTATASTFALRPTPPPPVYVKREQSEDGRYVDSANVRYSVDWGHMVTSPDGREPEELGYTLFATLDDALTEWGLTEYMEIPGEASPEQTEQ